MRTGRRKVFLDELDSRFDEVVVTTKIKEAIPDTWNCLFCFDAEQIYAEGADKLSIDNSQWTIGNYRSRFTSFSGMLKVAATHTKRSWATFTVALKGSSSTMEMRAS